MRKDDPQLKIRLPATLKADVESAAASAQRTINAEVIHRLSQSFQATEPTPDFPEEVVMAVQDEMDARGGTFTEALTRLVLIAHGNGGTIFSIRVAPGMTTETIRDVLKASETVVPPDASLVYVRERA